MGFTSHCILFLYVKKKNCGKLCLVSQFATLCTHGPRAVLQISISIFRDFKTSGTLLGHSISLERAPEINKFSWHSDVIPFLKSVVL